MYRICVTSIHLQFTLRKLLTYIRRIGAIMRQLPMQIGHAKYMTDQIHARCDHSLR